MFFRRFQFISVFMILLGVIAWLGVGAQSFPSQAEAKTAAHSPELKGDDTNRAPASALVIEAIQ